MARIGLAWQRAGALQEGVVERLGDPPPGHPLPFLVAAPEFVDRLAVLGTWNDAAREAAAAQGIDVVFVLERARCKSASAVTGEYGDRSGRTARVRFVGAEWDVSGSLLASALQWKSLANTTVQGASQPPWSVPKEHLGEKVELEIDPDAALAEAVVSATSRALARAGARILWERRVDWLASGGEDPHELAPWPWFDLSQSSEPLPLASLAQRARADLAVWQRRWDALPAEARPEDACGWCGQVMPTDEACACPEAEGLGSLVSGVRHLIAAGREGSSAIPLHGVGGSQPREVFADSRGIDAELSALPEAFRNRLLAPGQRFARPRLVRVLIYADDLPRELVGAFDPDYAACLRELASYGGASLESSLGVWNLKLQKPAAALVRLDPRSVRANAKLLERIHLRTADAKDLEQLFAKALRAALEDEP